MGIPDWLVKYLTVVTLEAAERVQVPPALFVLTRDRLCGPNPTLHKKLDVAALLEVGAVKAHDSAKM